MEEYVEQKIKSQVQKFVKSAFKIVFIAILIIAFILLFGYVFMWLWNWLMPEIFGLTTLTYWQAIGLLLMGKLVFGGFEGHGPGKSGKKSNNRASSTNRWACKNDFSKWKHYDTFWEEEGGRAYTDYVARKKSNQNNS